MQRLSGRRDPRTSLISRHKFIWVFGLALPVVVYAVFVGFPIARTFYLSLTDWDGISPTQEFIGLANYQALIHDPAFWQSFKNSAIWTLLTIIIPVGGGFLLAAYLANQRPRIGDTARSVLFLPATISLVAVGLMFRLILNPVFGAMNALLSAVGLEELNRDWLGDPSINLYVLIMVFSWAYIGFPLVMFYAGIQQIPAELYENAELAGASALQTLRYVTIPLIRPVAGVVVVLAGLAAIRSFDQVLAMTRGGPYGTTTVLGYFMYSQTFLSYHYGYGAAISVVILLISGLFAFFYLRSLGRDFNADT